MIQVAILDKDESYIKALADYLHSEYGQAFRIFCYTELSSLKANIGTLEAIDVLLVNVNLDLRELELLHVRRVLLLEESHIESEEADENIVFKYQTGDKLAKRILMEYEKDSTKGYKLSSGSKPTKLMGLYSPIGGCGKSTIAYHLAKQYDMQDKKVLFISFDSYSIISVAPKEIKKYGLTYLIYLLKSKAGNLQVKLESVTEIDTKTNIHFINGQCSAIELKDITLEDVEVLLQFLKLQSQYDAVIIDMHSFISDMVLGAFKHCDHIVYIQCNDELSKKKLRQFDDQVGIIDAHLGIKLSEKLLPVMNKLWENEDVVQETLLKIPYIPDNVENEHHYSPLDLAIAELYLLLQESTRAERIDYE